MNQPPRPGPSSLPPPRPQSIPSQHVQYDNSSRQIGNDNPFNQGSQTQIQNPNPYDNRGGIQRPPPKPLPPQSNPPIFDPFQNPQLPPKPYLPPSSTQQQLPPIQQNYQTAPPKPQLPPSIQQQNYPQNPPRNIPPKPQLPPSVQHNYPQNPPPKPQLPPSSTNPHQQNYPQRPQLPPQTFNTEINTSFHVHPHHQPPPKPLPPSSSNFPITATHPTNPHYPHSNPHQAPQLPPHPTSTSLHHQPVHPQLPPPKVHPSLSPRNTHPTDPFNQAPLLPPSRPQDPEPITAESLLPFYLLNCSLYFLNIGTPVPFLQDVTNLYIFYNDKKQLCLQPEHEWEKVVVLERDQPCVFNCNDFDYILKDERNNYYYLLIDRSTPEEIVDKLETVFMFFSIFYKKHLSDDERKKIKEMSGPLTKSTEISVKIENAGEKIAKGLVTGSGKLGDTLGSSSLWLKNRTAKGNNDEVSDETKAKFEKVDKGAKGFRKGMGAVMGGIHTATETAGKGIGHGVQKAKETDYYRHRQMEKDRKNAEEGEQEPGKADAAKNIGGASVNAVLNVWSGTKIGARNVGRDVRDNTSDVVAHKYGDQHAELTSSGFNIGANAGLGTFSTVSLLSLQTYLVPKLALQVGIGTLSYDPFKQDVLSGVPWKEVDVEIQVSVIEPWARATLLLRTYSLAWYLKDGTTVKDKIQGIVQGERFGDEKPVKYFPLRKVRDVRKVRKDHSKKDWSFEIIFVDEIQWTCIEHGSEEMIDEWINIIMNLSFVQKYYLK